MTVITKRDIIESFNKTSIINDIANGSFDGIAKYAQVIVSESKLSRTFKYDIKIDKSDVTDIPDTTWLVSRHVYIMLMELSKQISDTFTYAFGHYPSIEDLSSDDVKKMLFKLFTGHRGKASWYSDKIIADMVYRLRDIEQNRLINEREYHFYNPYTNRYAPQKLLGKEYNFLEDDSDLLILANMKEFLQIVLSKEAEVDVDADNMLINVTVFYELNIPDKRAGQVIRIKK